MTSFACLPRTNNHYLHIAARNKANAIRSLSCAYSRGIGMFAQLAQDFPAIIPAGHCATIERRRRRRTIVQIDRRDNRALGENEGLCQIFRINYIIDEEITAAAEDVFSAYLVHAVSRRSNETSPAGWYILLLNLRKLFSQFE